MKRIAAMLLNAPAFGSGTRNTPAFKSFARKFKNDFKKELATVGATELKMSVGHFYLSGFFDFKGQTYYFSISDVRDGFSFNRQGQPQMLYRTAKNRKDYTGGANQRIAIGDGMAEKMNLKAA